MTVLSSTAKSNIDRQLIRRGWLFNADETIEQTGRIEDLIIEQETDRVRKIAKKMLFEKEEWSTKVLRALIDKLEPVNVLIYYPRTLLDMFDKSNLRIRGDYSKILTVCRLYGILLQYADKDCVMARERKLMALAPERAIEIVELMKPIMQSMQAGLDETSLTMIPFLEQLDEKKEQFSMIQKSDRDKLAILMHKSEDSIRGYLHRWQIAGVVSQGGTKRSMFYTLLCDPKDIRDKLQHTVHDGSKEEIINKMTKETQEFRKKVLESD